MSYFDGPRKRYLVNVTQVAVRLRDGSEKYVRRGRRLPPDARLDVIDRLLDLGLIVEDES